MIKLFLLFMYDGDANRMMFKGGFLTKDEVMQGMLALTIENRLDPYNNEKDFNVKEYIVGHIYE